MNQTRLSAVGWPIALGVLLQFWPLTLAMLFLIAFFWLFQVVELMSLKEEDFPGPYVRHAWIALFVFAWVLAPIAFYLWRRRNSETASVKSRIAKVKNRKSRASNRTSPAD